MKVYDITWQQIRGTKSVQLKKNTMMCQLKISTKLSIGCATHEP